MPTSSLPSRASVPTSVPAVADRNPTFLQRHLTKVTILVVVVAWGQLAIGLARGQGRINVFTNTPMAEDLLSLHAAGTIMRTAPDRLYDEPFAAPIQAATLGPVGREVYNRYMSPPHTALIFAPLSLLPFPLVVWLWSLLSLAGLLAVPRLLGVARPLRCAGTMLAFVPVLDGFAAGQNALFTLFLFALSFWCWRRGRGFAAGLALGAVAIYKPHLIVGPAVLYLLEARRDVRPLLGLGLVVGGLLALDLWLFPAQSRAFVAWGSNVVVGREPLWARLRPGGEFTVTAFFALSLPGAPLAARLLTTLTGLGAVITFGLVHRRLRLRTVRSPVRIDRGLFACATLLTLWLAPHAHLYEWTLLLLPAILFWRDRGSADETLRRTFALTALLAPLCVRLARAQLGAMGMAIHPALPILLLGSIVVVRLAWRARVRGPVAVGVVRSRRAARWVRASAG
jgi:hypothetical protein